MATSVGKDEPDGDGDLTMKEPKGVSSPHELQMALYARCASMDEARVFGQDELLSFNIIPENSIQQLLLYTKQLAKDGLFKIMTKDNKICWKVVKKADAAKYKLFSPDEALVFSYIETAQREGIWSRLLRNKTNLHMTSMNRAIKSLENRNFIKSIKSVKFPNRKTYMLAKLQPSEDMTGGPFHTDGVLDEEFVFQMSHWSEKYILGRSWVVIPTSKEMTRKKSGSKLTQEQAEQLRFESLSLKGPAKDRDKAILPYPGSYDKYPTLSEVTKAINDSGISGITMKESEMKRILDILYWDGRIEKVQNGKAYRVTRSAIDDSVNSKNGLTESPCGRCPVFDDCEEDGLVNAKTCEYFQEWLQV